MVRQALVSLVTLGALATVAMPASARPHWEHGARYHGWRAPVRISVGTGPVYYGGPAYSGDPYYYGGVSYGGWVGGGHGHWVGHGREHGAAGHGRR